MQVSRHRIVLVGMLLAFRVFVCAQDAGGNTPAIKARTGRQNPSVFSDPDRDLMSKKADEAAGKAILLRQKQTEKNLNAAATWFRKGAHLYQSAGSFGKAAEAGIQTGEIYFLLGQYHSALKSYNQALVIAHGDAELRCRVLSRMARTYIAMGETSLADSYSQQALSLSTGLSSKTQAEALLARGETLQYSDVDNAAELFTQSREHFAQAEDGNGEAKAALMLAYLRFRGQRAEALRLAGQALQLWSSNGNLDGVAQARAALGIFAGVTGEFATAECNYQRALPVFHTLGDKDYEGVTLNGLGYVTRERGDTEASLDNYRRAEAIFSGVHDRLGTVEAITGMGKALSTMQRNRELLPLLSEKLRLARQSRIPALEASALTEMAHVYQLERQYARAEALYKQALAEYRSEHRDYGVGDVLLALAELQAEQARYPQALSLLESARPHKEKTAQIEDVARIDYEMAENYRRLHRLEDARAAIEKTIAVIEAQRLKIANFDSRASYFASVHKYYSLYIQILMLLHQQHPEQGFLELGFEASEKSKVRALLDLLSASGPGSTCEELLRKQLALTDSDQSQAAGMPEAPAAPVLGLKQIQAEVGGDDTVLLEYALGDKKSYAWVVDQNRIVVRELPGADEIRKLVQSLRSVLTARQPRHGESLDKYRTRVAQADNSYRLYGRKLSQLLLGSVVLGNKKRILIVPDGSLQYIPFSALPLPGAAEKSVFLMNRYEVVVLPSASALNTLRQAGAKRPAPTSLAAILADPVFEWDDPRVRRSLGATKKTIDKPPTDLKIALRDVNESGHIDRLPGSSDEAKAMRKALGGQDVLVAEGFRASREYVLKGGLAGYRIIHFATHGIIDPRHPEMSGLILSLINEGGERQDGYLRLGDIYNLKLSADLVVLSACQSALGKNLESEGTIGLPRGFLQAGARSVIASLWKVDDEATAQFMKVFYERIQHGENPSSALRRAQLAMLRNPQWAAPFYWAAFVLQGDYH